MKQLDKKTINLLLIFILLTIISCKKHISKSTISTNSILIEKEKICLKKEDTLRIKEFANNLISVLKKDKKKINNYLYKGYKNPDIIALENINKYKVISIDINFEEINKYDVCNEVYINFNVLTEIFTDDEGNNHNVENSISLKIENVQSKIKIFRIFVAG